MIRYKAPVLAILTFLLVGMFSCSNQKDLIFGASDELHYLKLYSTDSKFEILHNGINTAEGTFNIKSDTIYLNYGPNEWIPTDDGQKKHADEILCRTLFIDSLANMVQSIDGSEFCAKIYLNKLH